ncbi:MAG: NAD-dependent epimerase/dehydratase family protein, partial [Candidatus Rokubacteria bacterium]|nr:NAD-dependent epimerase/dehydratase family protein [Candidatus Rokubacteria bacterium]
MGNDGPYCGVRAAVLGASGFIGRWVARALCAERADVYLVVRDGTHARAIFSRYGIRGTVVEQDLGEPAAAGALVRTIRPSITFNLVGYGVDPSERDDRTAYAINAFLVEALCGAAAEACDRRWRGQDIVHVGSALEYGDIGGSLSEDSAPKPTTLYGRSKLAGTEVLLRSCPALGLKGLTARLLTVYGPGEHRGRLLPSLVDAARMGKSVRLTAGDQKRDFTYVEDVAGGLLRLGLAAAKPGEIVNLASGQLTSVRTFAETAAEILNLPQDRLEFGAIPTRPEEMAHSE